jgi:hypothetical protein
MTCTVYLYRLEKEFHRKELEQLPGMAKVFRISQLVIQYLLFCQVVRISSSARYSVPTLLPEDSVPLLLSGFSVSPLLSCNSVPSLLPGLSEPPLLPGHSLPPLLSDLQYRHSFPPIPQARSVTLILPGHTCSRSFFVKGTVSRVSVEPFSLRLGQLTSVKALLFIIYTCPCTYKRGQIYSESYNI